MIQVDVGDRSRIAFELTCEEESQLPWMMGNLRVWIGGEGFGTFEMPALLGDVLTSLYAGAWRAGDRETPRFRGMEARKAFRLLRSGLRTPWQATPLAERERWARHLFLPGVDVFDSVTAFVLEEGGSARVLYSRSEDPMCLLLESGEVDRRLGELRSALDSLGRRAGTAGW